MKQIPKIMKKYLDEQGIKELEFTAAINAALAPNPPLTNGAISHWFTGRRVPNYYPILTIYMHGHGWVVDWALEILKELKPDLYRESKDK